MSFDASTLLDVSHSATFLGGAFVGAAGQYLADRFTDQRRKQQFNSDAKKQFLELKADMSKLFSEMRLDLVNDESKSTREFVITPSKNVNFNGRKLRFFYYENEHAYVQLQVDRLLNLGYLEDVTTGSASIYRMQEHFVLLLKKYP